MIDTKEEILAELRGTQLTWELRESTWSMEGVFDEEPVQVVRIVNPIGPTAVRAAATCGPAPPGKTPFPQGWSADQIMHHVSDIATDPSLQWVQQTGKGGSLFTKSGAPARFFTIGVRDGLAIKVIL